jgi:hypothetical protein
LALIARHDFMHAQDFAQHPLHGHARIQRAERVLKDELHPFTQRPQFTLRQFRHVDAVKHHAAVCGLDQP